MTREEFGEAFNTLCVMRDGAHPKHVLTHTFLEHCRAVEHVVLETKQPALRIDTDRGTEMVLR